MDFSAKITILIFKLSGLKIEFYSKHKPKHFVSMILSHSRIFCLNDLTIFTQLKNLKERERNK